MFKNGFNKLGVGQAKENQGTLIGWEQIHQYLGLCVSTMIRYRRDHGLPICNMPDNRVFTTKNLIDQWVIARMLEQESLTAQAEHKTEPSTDNQELTPDS